MLGGGGGPPPSSAAVCGKFVCGKCATVFCYLLNTSEVAENSFIQESN